MKTTLVVALVAVAVLGFASFASAATLSAVMQNPESFLHQNVEITAPVAVNSQPQGGEYKTWHFVLGQSADNGLMVERKGFNPATIVEAYQLVDTARQANGQVTVTGRLEQKDSGVVLELKTVQYKDSGITVTDGPFVDTVYEDDCYPGSQKFYDGYTYFPGQFPF